MARTRARAEPVLTALTWVLAGCVALAAVALVALPLAGTYRTSTVLSASMEPAMPVGALLVTVARPVDAIAVGDVVAVRLPDGRTRAHRVTEVTTDTQPVIRTAGDANPVADPEPQRLMGEEAWVVTTTIPGLGRGLLFLRSGPVRGVLGGVLPLTLAVAYLVPLWLARAPRHLAARSARRSSIASRVAAVVLVATAAVLVPPPGTHPAAASGFSGAATLDQAPVSSATLAAPTGPAAQARCLLLGLLSPNILVTWSPSTTPGVAGHVVERWSGSSWVEVAVLGAATSSWVDAPVPLGATRSYRIRATAGTWRSPPTATVSATVPLLCL